MPSREPTYDSLQAELDQVLARHNELLTKTPGYVAAMLIQEADYRRAKHGVDLVVREVGDGVWCAKMGPTGAVLGVGGDPSKLDGVDVDLAMVDHRGAAP